MKKKTLHFGKHGLGILVAILLLALSAQAQEDSTGIPVSADTYVRSTTSDGSNVINYGGITTFYVRNSVSTFMQLGLLRFDASAISLPANVNLDSAKVFLTTSTVAAALNVQLISVSDATDGWDENAITWNSYKAGDVDTLATIATTRVGAINTRYSWDVTNHLRSELTSGNKIVSLAVFQDYNQSGNTSFVTKEGATDGNGPLLALYTHTVPVKVVNLEIAPDTAAGTIALSWKTPLETGTTNWAVERSTDGVNFTQIHSEAAGGTTSDTTSYSYTDATPDFGYTYYYRIRYDVTGGGESIYSDVVSTPFFKYINIGDAADSYVRYNTTDNYGAEPAMTVKNDGYTTNFSRTSFIKFDLSNYSGTAKSAKLKLYVTAANTNVPNTTYYLWKYTDDTWEESTITGKTAPAQVTTTAADTTNLLLSTTQGRVTGSWIEFDIPTSAINDALAGDKLLSLAITGANTSSTDDVQFATKENADPTLAPVLSIEQAAANSLPVKLSPLTATKIANGVQLNWKSYTELNAAHYTIERSTDGSNFGSIGTVAATGNSSTAHAYTYTDGQPATGINYYRLSAVDADGQSSLSNVVTINYKGTTGNGNWSVYPNPVRKGANVTIKLASSVTGNVIVKVVDMSGRIRINQAAAASGNLLMVNTSTLSTGVYIVQLYNQQGQIIGSSSKILIQ